MDSLSRTHTLTHTHSHIHTLTHTHTCSEPHAHHPLSPLSHPSEFLPIGISLFIFCSIFFENTDKGFPLYLSFIFMTKYYLIKFFVIQHLKLDMWSFFNERFVLPKLKYMDWKTVVAVAKWLLFGDGCKLPVRFHRTMLISLGHKPQWGRWGTSIFLFPNILLHKI